MKGWGKRFLKKINICKMQMIIHVENEGLKTANY